MGIKVIHIADIHLGMENYGRPDPRTGLNSRLVDFLGSFDQVVDYALNHRVDMVVFAGDAFKNRDPNPTLQREFAKRIKKLSAAGIPVVLLVGNHDVPNSESKAHSLEIYRTLAVDKVYVARRPDVLRISTENGIVQVACLPYLSRSSLLSKEDYKNLSLEELDQKMGEVLTMLIAKLARDLDPSLPSIFTGHLSVANAVLGSEKSIMIGKDLVLPLSSVALAEFDYVALGHIHRHQVLNEFPPVVYAGSLDRIDFGEEKEAKGFCVVDLAKGAASFQFQKLQTREFISLNLKPEEADPTQEVLTALTMHDLSQAVVRLNLTLSAEQAALLRLDEIHRYLNREAYFVAGVTRHITDALTGVRSQGMTEQLEPLAALNMYIDLQPGLSADKTQLMELAKGLIQELEEEVS